MSQVLVTESYLDAIADAIRDKNGSEDTYTPAQMAGAIDNIQTADEVVLVSKSVTANGTYNPASDSADGYSDVTVDVPNTYTVSDNGKVVVNQALTDQTSKSINSNGTHDTTANNSVVVDVPNSYAAADEGKVVSGGALVGQTSLNVTSNGTYDTTEKNQIVVQVPSGGGGGTLQEKTISMHDIISLSQNAKYSVSPDSGFDGIFRIDITDIQRYIWEEYAIFTTNGMSSNGWLSDDETKSIILNGGDWTVENNKLIANGAYYSFPVPGSNILVQCKCSIQSGFAPKSDGNWYSQSCIFGMELPGGQRDYGVTIPSRNLYTPSIGYASGAPEEGSISINPDEEHVISLLYTGSEYYLWIDGVLSATHSYTATGTHLSQMGLFWNKDNSSTAVKGAISAIGIWSFSLLSDSLPIVLPDFL